MIAFDKHIEYLLLNNDCVIVPNLGGFVAHTREAEYDSKTSVFYPPYRALGFNPQLKINDNLLVQSYIETYDLSYPEALRRIEVEVEELRQILATKGCFDFHGLGKLNLDINGNYIFEPFEAGILTPSYYGLEASSIKQSAQQLLKTINQDSELDEQASQNGVGKVISIYRRRASDIAMAAAVAFAFFFFASTADIKTNNTSTQIATTHFINDIFPTKMNNTKGDIRFDKNVAGNIVTTTKTSVEKANTNNNSQIKIIKADNNKPNNYYGIVLASQVTKANAEEFVARLTKNGIKDPHIISQKSGLKVVAGYYATESGAYEALSEIRKNKELKDAWIMFVK